jgi:hypothetical protein
MKVKAWCTDSSGLQASGAAPPQLPIDAGVRSVRCVRGHAHDLAGISAGRIGTGLPVWSWRVSFSVGAGD